MSQFSKGSCPRCLTKASPLYNVLPQVKLSLIDGSTWDTSPIARSTLWELMFCLPAVLFAVKKDLMQKPFKHVYDSWRDSFDLIILQ
ncbi:hypothetical protein AOXY_G13626 [Acipenser oxyrinchus oxyrinchus]|uniref:Uncharacterized protein n=1 Tax=Acipenser oxyrinchus oxyrinchus TaxID=40147 RepID=A0AAD8D9T4_ACIOX|nr:hypothetical protein AOXY_G13626 [Acipenser oxyrinchus oxyrinchus]